MDQINEEDKYGNSGDKFAGVGRFVVNGIEGFSNVINKLFEVSFKLLLSLLKAEMESEPGRYCCVVNRLPHHKMQRFFVVSLASVTLSII